MAGDGPRATLGSAWLDERGTIAWAMKEGVQPYVGMFMLDRDEAKKLPRGRTPVTLLAESTGRTLKVGGLYVTGEGPAPDPYTQSVIVTDVRIWWVRKHIRRSFNIRRRSASRRRVDDDQVDLAQVETEVDDVTFRETSMNEGKPYTAEAMAREVIEEVTEGKWSGDLAQFPQKQVDGVEIDDNGAAAVRRVLDFLPGAEVFVDRQGVTVIKNALDFQSTRQVIESSGSPIEDGGIPEFVTLGEQRPTAVNVLFTPEQEMRVDYLNGPQRDPTALVMANVVPVPDEKIEVFGDLLIRGSYARMDRYLEAIDIPEEFVRKYWTTTLLEEKYGLLGKLDTEADYPARVASIRAHYLQTFRISKYWMDRFESIRAYRCSVIDLETGVFGSSPSWQDWCVTPTANGLLFGPSEQFFVINLPDGVVPSEPLTGSRPASAIFSIVDADRGIIRVNPLSDYQGNFGIRHPSALDLPATSQARQKTYPISLDGSREGRSGASLSLKPDHRHSTIITVVPAAPNNKGRLYNERVEFQEAKDRLPQRSQGSVPNAIGPDWDIRISPGVATARFSWSHGLRNNIKQTFGVGAADGKATSRDTIKRLLSNPEEIKVFAQAMAAGLYSSMPDHYEGTKVVDMQQSIIPEGRITAVIHSISSDGAATTTILAPGIVRGEDPMSLLPESARNLIQRTVQP